MAPERVRAQPVDERPDLFAFGAILYEMLSGQRAFSRGSNVETAYAVLNDEPPPLPDSTPRALDRIVRRCLAKDRDARFESAGELEAALRAAVSQSGKNRLLDLALVVLALGVAVGLWRSPLTHDFIAGLLRAQAPMRQLAVLPFRAVGSDRDGEAFAEGLSEMLNNRLRQLEQFQGTLRVVSGNEVVREGISTAREARRAFGATLALTGSVRWSGDRLTVTSELVDTNTQTVLAARDLEGERNDTGALRARLLRRAIALDDRLVASQITMGLLHRAAGERDEAIASFQRALQLEPGSADGIRELGRAYDDAGRTQDAEATFRRAIELRPDSWAAYKDLGLFYNRHGRIKDAIPPLRHVVDLTPDNYNGYPNLPAMHLRLV